MSDVWGFQGFRLGLFARSCGQEGATTLSLEEAVGRHDLEASVPGIFWALIRALALLGSLGLGSAL